MVDLAQVQVSSVDAFQGCQKVEHGAVQQGLHQELQKFLEAPLQDIIILSLVRANPRQ